MITPASAGPTTFARLRVSASSALASCRRAGATTCGISPMSAGHERRGGEPVGDDSTASIQTSAVPVSSSAAVAACTTTRSEVGDDHHVAPAEAVGDDAADDREERERDAARREHEAEVGRRADPEHAEGDRDRDDAIAQDRQRLTPEEVAERTRFAQRSRESRWTEAPVIGRAG